MTHRNIRNGTATPFAPLIHSMVKSSASCRSRIFTTPDGNHTFGAGASSGLSPSIVASIVLVLREPIRIVGHGWEDRKAILNRSRCTSVWRPIQIGGAPSYYSAPHTRPDKPWACHTSSSEPSAWASHHGRHMPFRLVVDKLPAPALLPVIE
jgi:hypothetical protein